MSEIWDDSRSVSSAEVVLQGCQLFCDYEAPWYGSMSYIRQAMQTILVTSKKLQVFVYS